MRMHRLIVPFVAVLGGGVGALPALTSGATPPMTASFTAVDYHFNANGSRLLSTVTIAAGGTVSFAYPSGASMHNIDFGQPPLPQPSSCEINGTSQGQPIPTDPTGPGWSGSCTFDTPGTYNFHCDMHPGMTGTVIVEGSTTTTTTTISTTTTTTTTTPTTGTTTTGTTPTPQPTTSSPIYGYPPPNGASGTTTTYPSPTTTGPSSTGSSKKSQGSPLASAPKHAISLAGTQHGQHVTGWIKVSTAGRGGQAVIILRAKSGGHAIQIGHLRLRHLSSGRVRFTVAIDHAAALLLQHANHVTVTVKITVASASGRSVSVTEHVQLHA